jgi:4-hydroxy-tetrahydrodipicolinate synthase
MNLSGLGVAMITPFTTEGMVDYDAIPGLIENIATGCADYLVLMGTTAEVPTLTPTEKRMVISAVLEANTSKLPLVIGIGGNNTAAVIAEIQSTDLSPFQAIMSVMPYYNKPSQEGWYQHFMHIAAASPLPIILYNVPSRTGCSLDIETLLRLVNDSDNIIAIKEASGDIQLAESMIKSCPKHIQVISGEDSLTLPMLLAGAVGTISVLGNAFPVPLANLMQLVKEGNVAEAYAIHYKLLDTISLLFEEGNPVGVKGMLSLLGLCQKTVRLPLVVASDDLMGRMESAIRAAEFTV